MPILFSFLPKENPGAPFSTIKAEKPLGPFDLSVQAIVTGGKGTLPANVKPDGMVATANQLGGEIVDIQ